MISAIVTVHGPRIDKLQRTLISLSAVKNISEVVITATGFPLDKLHKIRNLSSKYKKVYNLQNYSGQAWIAGVAIATRDLCLLIHDGDIISPAFGEQQFAPDTITHYQGFNITQPWIHRELCLPNTPSNKSDFKRVLSKENTKTLSPGRGVFPRKFMHDTLIEFEQHTDEGLLVNDSLLIGNDWYLWWKAAIGDIPLTPIPLPLIGFDIEDSTTARSDKGNNYLLRLYNEVRKRVGVEPFQPDSTINMVYLGRNKIPIGFDNNQHTLVQRYAFKKCNFSPGEEATSDRWGTAAWATALEFAHVNGYKYLLYTEDDCRILDSTNYDRAMLAELDKAKDIASIANLPKPICYGTPIFWNPRGMGGRFFHRYLKYAAACPLPTMIQGALAHHERPAIYPNGALAIYDTSFFYPRFIPTAMAGIHHISPWDLHVGYRLLDEFRQDVFDYIIPSSVSYSDNGCSPIPFSARNLYNYPNVLAWHK